MDRTLTQLRKTREYLEKHSIIFTSYRQSFSKTWYAKYEGFEKPMIIFIKPRIVSWGSLGNVTVMPRTPILSQVQCWQKPQILSAMTAWKPTRQEMYSCINRISRVNQDELYRCITKGRKLFIQCDYKAIWSQSRQRSSSNESVIRHENIIVFQSTYTYSLSVNS